MTNDKVAATFHVIDAIMAGERPAPDCQNTSHAGTRRQDADLTPEQDLRAAVAERLVDVVHFGDCTDNPCTCLVGRLQWAIGAEEVASPASETEAAIEMVARHIRAHRLEALYICDLWEDYPEIGEDDWRAIVDAVSKPALAQMPDPDAYLAAYDLLTARSKTWEAEHGGGAA